MTNCLRFVAGKHLEIKWGWKWEQHDPVLMVVAEGVEHEHARLKSFVLTKDGKDGWKLGEPFRRWIQQMYGASVGDKIELVPCPPEEGLDEEGLEKGNLYAHLKYFPASSAHEDEEEEEESEEEEEEEAFTPPSPPKRKRQKTMTPTAAEIVDDDDDEDPFDMVVSLFENVPVDDQLPYLAELLYDQHADSRLREDLKVFEEVDDAAVRKEILKTFVRA